MKDNFIPPCPLITPVLFMIFNRPDTTQKVFNAIKQAKPKQLFVAADGHRKDKEGEKEKCEQARKIIEQVDWDCEVKTLFRDKNLGCKIAVSSAIDWFFENVEEGIILEDDCLPSQSFFWFCQELLERYKDDERILMITGFNVLSQVDITESYFFSKYPHIWGWASWRNSWLKYDVSISDWPKIKEKGIEYMFNITPTELDFWNNAIENVYNNRVNTWDLQVAYVSFKFNLSTITPQKSLIKNIGFNKDATHTKGRNLFDKIKQSEMIFPLTRPAVITNNQILDKKRYAIEYAKPNFIKRLLGYIIRKIQIGV